MSVFTSAGYTSRMLRLPTFPTGSRASDLLFVARMQHVEYHCELVRTEGHQ